MLISAKETKQEGVGSGLHFRQGVHRWPHQEDDICIKTQRRKALRRLGFYSLFYSPQLWNCLPIYNVIFVSPGRILQMRKMNLKDFPKIMQPLRF